MASPKSPPPGPDANPERKRITLDKRDAHQPEQRSKPAKGEAMALPVVTLSVT